MQQNPGMIAAIKISRLERLRCATVPIMPADFQLAGLKAERIVRTPNHEVLWFHVNRIDYINWLKKTHSISKKREINVRDSLRKP